MDSEILTLQVDINDDPMNQKVDAIEQRLSTLQKDAKKMAEGDMSSTASLPGYNEAFMRKLANWDRSLTDIGRTRGAMEHAMSSYEREDLSAAFKRKVEVANRSIKDLSNSQNLVQELLGALGPGMSKVFTQGLNGIVSQLTSGIRTTAMSISSEVSRKLTDDEIVDRYMRSDQYGKLIHKLGQQNPQAFTAQNMRKYLMANVPMSVPQYMRQAVAGGSQVQLRKQAESYRDMLPKSFQKIEPHAERGQIRQLGQTKQANAPLSVEEISALGRIVRNNRYAADAAVKAGVVSKSGQKMYFNHGTTHDMMDAMAGYIMDDMTAAALGERRYGNQSVSDRKAWKKSIQNKVGSNKVLDGTLQAVRAMDDAFGGWLNPGRFNTKFAQFDQNSGDAEYIGRITHSPRKTSRAFAEYTLDMMQKGAQISGMHPIVFDERTNKWTELTKVNGPKKGVGKEKGITPDDFHTINMNDAMLQKMVMSTPSASRVGQNGFSDNMFYLKFEKELGKPDLSKEDRAKIAKQYGDIFAKGYDVNGQHYINTRISKTHAEFMKASIVDELGRKALGYSYDQQLSAEEAAKARREGLALLSNGGGEGKFKDFKSFAKTMYNANNLATEAESLSTWLGTRFGFTGNKETERLLAQPGLTENQQQRIMAEHGTPNMKVVVGRFGDSDMDGNNWISDRISRQGFQGRTFNGKATYTPINMRQFRFTNSGLIEGNDVTDAYIAEHTKEKEAKIAQINKDVADEVEREKKIANVETSYRRSVASIMNKYGGDLVIPGAGATGGDLRIPKDTDVVEDINNIKNFKTVLKDQGLTQEQLNDMRSRDYSRDEIFAKTTYDDANTSSRWLSKQLVNSSMNAGFRDHRVREYFHKQMFDEIDRMNDDQYVRDTLFGGDQSVNLSSPEAQKTINDYVSGMWSRYNDGDRLLPPGVLKFAMAAPNPQNVINNRLLELGRPLTPEQQALQLQDNQVISMESLSKQMGLARFPATKTGDVTVDNVSAQILTKNGNKNVTRKQIKDLAEASGIVDTKGLYLAPGSQILQRMQGEDFDGDLNAYFALSEKAKPETVAGFSDAMRIVANAADAEAKELWKAAPGTPEFAEAWEKQNARKHEQTFRGTPDKAGGYNIYDPYDQAGYLVNVPREHPMMGAAERSADMAALYHPGIQDQDLREDLGQAIKDYESQYDVVSTQMKTDEEWEKTKEQLRAGKMGLSFSRMFKYANEAIETNGSNGESQREWTGRSQKEFEDKGIDTIGLPSILQGSVMGTLQARMQARAMGVNPDVEGFSWDTTLDSMKLPEGVAENSEQAEFVRMMRGVRKDFLDSKYLVASNKTIDDLQVQYEKAVKEIQDSTAPDAEGRKFKAKRLAAIGGQAFENFKSVGLTERNLMTSSETMTSLQDYAKANGTTVEALIGHTNFSSSESKPEFVRPESAKNAIVEKADKLSVEGRAQVEQIARKTSEEMLAQETPQQQAERLLKEAGMGKQQINKVLDANASDTLVAAIAGNDMSKLRSLPGVGAKTAATAMQALQGAAILGVRPTPTSEINKPVTTVDAAKIAEEVVSKENKATEETTNKQEPERSAYGSTTPPWVEGNAASGGSSGNPPPGGPSGGPPSGGNAWDAQAARDYYGQLWGKAQEFSSKLFGDVLTYEQRNEGTPDSIIRAKRNEAIAARYEQQIKEFQASPDYVNLLDEQKRNLDILVSPRNGLVAKAGRDFSEMSMYSSGQLVESIGQAELKATGAYDGQLEALQKWDEKIKEVQKDQERLLEMSKDPKYSKDLQEQFQKSADKVGQDLTKITTSRQNIGNAMQTQNQEAFNKQIENLENRIDPGSRYDQQARQYQQQISSIKESLTKKHDVGLISDEAFESDMQRLNDLEKGTTASALRMQQSLKAVGSQLTRSVQNVAMRFGRQMFQKALTEAKKFVVEYNRTMTEIQMITLKTDDQMNNLGDGLIAKAKELKISVAEVTKSAATLYRQGLTDDEVSERLDVISKFSKVSGTKVDAATKLITVAMNTGLVTDPSVAADIVTALGDNAATNAAEIERGIEKAGAAASADGTTFGQLAAMLTAITSTTQIGGSTAGRTLNTIFGRMNKIGTNELIYDENGNAISGSAVAKLLEAQGINQYDNGVKKSSYDTLYELSQKWDKMSDAEQQQIATAIAGTRQYSNFSAIMQGMAEGRVDQYMSLVGESAGITDKKYEVYVQSLDASLTNLKNTFDGLVKDLTEKGALTGFLDGISGAIQGVDNLADSIGGLGASLVAVIPLLLAVTMLKAGMATGNAPMMLLGLGAGAAAFAGFSALGATDQTKNEISANEYARKGIQVRNEDTSNVSSLISESRELLAKSDRSDDENVRLKQNLTDLSEMFSYLGVSVDDLTGSSEKAAKALDDISNVNDENKKRNTRQELQDIRTAINTEGSSQILASTKDVKHLATSIWAYDNNRPKNETGYDSEGHGYLWKDIQDAEKLRNIAYGLSAEGNRGVDFGKDFGQDSRMPLWTLRSNYANNGTAFGGGTEEDFSEVKDLIRYFIDNEYYRETDSALQGMLSNPGAQGLSLDDILAGKTDGYFTPEFSNKFFEATANLFSRVYSGDINGIVSGNVEEIKEDRDNAVHEYSEMIRDTLLGAVNAPSSATADALIKDWEKSVLVEGYENLPAESFFSLLSEKYNEFCAKIFADDGSVNDVQPISTVYEEEQNDGRKYSYKGENNLTRSEAYAKYHADQAAAEEETVPEIETVYTYGYNGKTGLSYQEAEDALHRAAFAAYAGEGVGKQGYYSPNDYEHYYDDEQALYDKYEARALVMMAEDANNGKLNNVTKENWEEAKRLYQRRAISEAVRNGELVPGIFVNDEDQEMFLTPEQADKWVDEAAEADNWGKVDIPTIEPSYSFNGESGLTWDEALKKQYAYRNKNVGHAPIPYYESRVETAVRNAETNAGVSEAKRIHADSFVESVQAAGVTDLQSLLEAAERGEIENFDDVIADLGLSGVLNKAYAFDPLTGKITANDKGGAIFAKIMAAATSGSRSYAGIGENAFITSKQHGQNVFDYLTQFANEGVDIQATDEEMKAVLGDALASRFIEARTSGRMDKISAEEMRYAQTLAKNYSSGLTGLTAEQRLSGIKEVRAAIASGAYQKGEYSSDIADQYMSQWSDWSEYAALLSKKQAGTLSPEDIQRMSVLETSLSNFEKNAEIKIEVEGAKQLEEAGKIAEGTAAKIEKLRKGGKVKVDVEMQIHNEAFESGQKRARLFNGNKAEQDEAAMALLGMSKDEYFENRDANLAKAQQIDRETYQGVDADTWMQLYQSEKTVEGRQIIRDAAAKAGFVLSRGSSNQTFEYVGAPLVNTNPLTGTSRAYTEAEKNAMLDRILAGEKRTIGANGNSELYDAALDVAGENTRELLRRQNENRLAGREENYGIETSLLLASQQERSAYRNSTLSGYSTKMSQAQQAQWALNNPTNASAAGYISTMLGMNETDVQKMLNTSEGKTELTSQIKDSQKALYSEMAKNLADIELDQEDMSSWKEQLQEAADGATGYMQQFLQWMADTVTEGGEILADAGNKSFSEVVAEVQKGDIAKTEALNKVNEFIQSGNYAGILNDANADYNQLDPAFLYMLHDRATSMQNGTPSVFSDEMITNAYQNALLGRESAPQTQQAVLSHLFGNNLSPENMVSTYQTWMKEPAKYEGQLSAFNGLQNIGDVKEAVSSETNAINKTTEAMKKYNQEMGVKALQYAKAFGDHTDDVTASLFNLAKGGKTAAKEVVALNRKVFDAQDAMTAWSEAYNGGKVKSGKQVSKGGRKAIAQFFDVNESEVEKWSADEMAKYFANDNVKDSIQQEITDVVNAAWNGALNDMEMNEADLQLNGEPITFKQAVDYIFETNDPSEQFARLQEVTQGIQSDAINLLASLAQGKIIEWMAKLNSVGSGDTFKAWVTASTNTNANRKSGGGYGYHNRGGGGGGGGGGKSAADKAIEEADYRVTEAKHKVTMAQTEQQHYAFTNNYQAEIDSIYQEVSAQKGLAEVYAENLESLRAQQAAVQQYSEDWWKLEKQILSTEEALAETNNTIEALSQKEIAVVQRKQENEDAPHKFVRSMIDSYVERYETQYQSGGTMTEDKAYKAWEKQKVKQTQSIQQELAQNTVQIAEWQALLATLDEDSQSYKEVQQKIWDIQKENAELENQLLQQEIELNNARLERIAKTLQNKMGRSEHEINLSDTQGQIYQIKRDYSGYRAELAKQKSQYKGETSYYAKALEQAKEQMNSLTEGSAAWYKARDAVYEYEEALKKLQLTQEEIDQAIRESYLSEAFEKIEQADTKNQQNLTAAQIETQRAKLVGDDKGYIKGLEKEEKALTKQAESEKKNLETLMELKNSGKIKKGTKEWDELLQKIKDVQNQVNQTENDALAKANEVAAARLEKIMNDYEDRTRDTQHQFNMIQYQETYYKSNGELTNYGAALQAEQKNRKELLKQQKKTREELLKELNRYEVGSDQYNNVLEQIQRIEEEIAKTENAINSTGNAIKENQEAIRKVKIALENTLNNEMKKRIQEEKEQLSATVNLQKSILDTIKKRYQDEWKLIKQDLEKKKKALQEEKSLIQERMKARKEAEQTEDKQTQLAELQKQLAIVEADPTRSKEAKELRKQIEDLQKEISDNLADNIADAEQKRLDDIINGISDYVSNHEQDLNEFLQDNTNFQEILDSVLGGAEKDYIKYMKENDETYKNATAEQKKLMEQGWHDTWLKMKGDVENYWKEVLHYTDINEENQAQIRKEFIEYMKQGSEYQNASATKRKSLVYEWGKMFDDYVASMKKTENAGKPETTDTGEGGSDIVTGKKVQDLFDDLKNSTLKTMIDGKVMLDDKYSKALSAIANSITGTNQYLHGGIVDYTGLAKVDGTPGRPEAFLDAVDTANVRAMVDQLNYMKTHPIVSQVPAGSFINNNMSVGDVYVTINEAEISSDQDIEALAKKVGQSFTRQLSRNGFNTANYAF